MSHMLFPDLQGFTLDDEVACLVRHAQGREVLEIGAWKGRTTFAMATTALHVHAVDTFTGDEFTGKGNFLPEFQANMVRRRCHNVTYSVGLFTKVCQLLRGNFFDMVFYDADHTFEATHRGLEVANDLVREMGTICVHDYNKTQPQYAGAVAAVDAFVVTTPWRIVEQVGSLIALRRR